MSWSNYLCSSSTLNWRTNQSKISGLESAKMGFTKL